LLTLLLETLAFVTAPAVVAVPEASTRMPVPLEEVVDVVLLKTLDVMTRSLIVPALLLMSMPWK
jgi:hypothetical protein